MSANGKLLLNDIADLRAYEQSRRAFRARIIELKKRRRVGVGPIVTLVFVMMALVGTVPTACPKRWAFPS